MSVTNPSGTNNFAKVFLIVILVLVGIGVVVRMLKSRVIDPRARFNFLYIDQDLSRNSLISYDPVEEKVLIITFPPDLQIKSRSVGKYEVGSLYKLGQYQGSGGEFARRKVQGFMRLPIIGYLVGVGSNQSVEESLKQELRRGIVRLKQETNMGYLDRLFLLGKMGKAAVRVVGIDELARAGILVKSDEGWDYNSERLTNYVGESFFDWQVGQEGATVAIINQSGLDGMGADMAKFMTSLGLDVIMVRNGESEEEKTSYQVDNPKSYPKSLKLIERVFGFFEYSVGTNEVYRANIVVWVGRDALELF